MKKKKDNVINLFPHLVNNHNHTVDHTEHHITHDGFIEEQIQQNEMDRIADIVKDEKEKVIKMFSKKIKDIDTYEAALNSLLLIDINDIIRYHRLYLSNKLKKKEKIEKILLSKEEMMKGYLSTMTYEELSYIKKIANNEGIKKIVADKIIIEDQLSYRIRGIVFTGTLDGQLIEYIPGDVLNLINDYVNDFKNIKRAKQSTEIFTLAKGVLCYYGGIREPQLVDMLMNFLKIDEEVDDCRDDIIQRLMYLGEIGTEWHRTAGGMYLHEEFEYIDEMFEENAKCPYYEMSYKEAIFAGKNYYTKFDKAHNTFANYIKKNFSVPTTEGIEIISEFMDRIKWGESPEGVIEDTCSFFEFFSKEELEEFIGMLTDVFDNTPLWVIRGNTVNGIKALEK